MKLYLFGGVEINQGQGLVFKKMINNVLDKIKTK
jgi:hypothetical protein